MSLKEVIIADASKAFLERCPGHISKILAIYQILLAKDVDSIKLYGELTNLINDLKSDSGAYEIIFIANACCNLIDFNKEKKRQILDGEFSVNFPKDVLDLMSSFVNDLIKENIEQKKFHKELDDAATSRRMGRHRVLVVERDNALISHYQNFFNDLGISYSFVKSGIEAFHRLLNEKFDTVITSVHVGVIDGLSLVALTKVVNSQNIGIKTILVAMGDVSVLPLHSMPYKLVLRDENLFSELEHTYEKILSIKDSELRPIDISRGFSILALDDDDEVHNLLKMGLNAKNITLRCATNSKDFFLMLEKKRPDLILLDVGLDQESGVDVLKALRENPLFYSTPVMFLTARESDERGQNLENTDAIGIISKPFSPKNILKNIIDLYELYYPQASEKVA